jgi:Mg2+/Co2+ transporter CorB
VRRLESYVSTIPLASLVVLALGATIATLVAESEAGILGIVMATPVVVVAVATMVPRLAGPPAEGRLRTVRERTDRGGAGGDSRDSVFQQSEQQMIESIIDFGATVAREVMVPRPDMITVASTFRAADVTSPGKSWIF